MIAILNWKAYICDSRRGFLLRDIDTPTLLPISLYNKCLHHPSISKQDLKLTRNMATSHNISLHCGDRDDPKIVQIGSSEFQGIFSKGLKILHNLFSENNYELRLCGGAVRDLLQSKTPKDLDFATTATPDQMISMFKKEGIRLINETGWGHGTVTCRLEEENFEITTLRIDRVTDGRHATVEFTTDWKTDASRRDLTINALFLTLEGQVIDYFNGIEDLKHRTVRFVGDAARRIQEDYLRILRFFRFYGRIAQTNTTVDQDLLQIIADNVSGLKNVAGERIQTEVRLIFEGNHIVTIVNLMHRCGLFPFIGLPEHADLEKFAKIYNSARHLNPHYMTYVSALLPSLNDLNTYHQRVKFSNLELNIATFILKNSLQANIDIKLTWYTDLLVYNYRHDRLCANYFMEFLKYNGDVEAIGYFTNFSVPLFPVKGNVLKEKTGLKGKEIGKALNILFKKWQDSRYILTQDQLLENVDETTDWNSM
ncbi:unnamed protein product [Clavelina lepadiformis]|uniref:CCA tRNA nucleotidyltransferase 1, mitochondrial n=1 Tax=Clavelina lepadiformis TaxID=159417 RepID=A0ABP0FGA5_CLALP